MSDLGQALGWTCSEWGFSPDGIRSVFPSALSLGMRAGGEARAGAGALHGPVRRIVRACASTSGAKVP